MSEINRRCKYCGEKLKSEYIFKQGICYYCDNEKCKVKPMTDYNFASSKISQEELNKITLDKWEKN